MGEWAEAIILAVIQGLTEFLPVSSSGHLDAWKRLSGSELQGDLSLDVLLHCGTLCAVLIVYRAEVWRLVASIWRGGDARRDLAIVVVGTIPAGLVGLLFEDRIESLSLTVPWLLPLCWGGCGLALLSTRGRRATSDEPVGAGLAGVGLAGVGLAGALWIGAWQAVALLPGVSRSGITIVAALWFGVRREVAARYSFLIVAPLIAAATVLKIPDLAAATDASRPVLLWVVAFAVSFLVGWGALIVLLRMLRGGRLHLWGYYLLVVSAAFAITMQLRGES